MTTRTLEQWSAEIDEVGRNPSDLSTDECRDLAAVLRDAAKTRDAAQKVVDWHYVPAEDFDRKWGSTSFPQIVSELAAALAAAPTQAQRTESEEPQP